MIERGYRIVYYNSVISADFAQFGQETAQRESTLLALTQHLAVMGYALLRRESHFYDAVAQVAPISQVKRNMG
jgi:hypothetical protein